MTTVAVKKKPDVQSIEDVRSPAATRCLMIRFISGVSVMLIFTAVDMVG